MARRGFSDRRMERVTALETAYLPADKSYNFIAALRPFSLVVAIVSCGLGIQLANPGTSLEIGLAVAVMSSGLLLQCGVNLINDRIDLQFLHPEMAGWQVACRQIRRNFRTGLWCFALASVIGGWIALQAGFEIVIVGLVGLAGAYAYTQEPFNYKRRGLGVVFVFALMGVLMVQGAYLAISSEFSLRVLGHSLPISCLVSLLLLSNELRDFENDEMRGIRTLTVNIGFVNAARLYWCLIIAAYLLSGLLVARGELKLSAWLLLPLVLMPLLSRYLYASQRRPLTIWSGRFLLLFGIGYLLALP